MVRDELRLQFRFVLISRLIECQLFERDVAAGMDQIQAPGVSAVDDAEPVAGRDMPKPSAARLDIERRIMDPFGDGLSADERQG